MKNYQIINIVVIILFCILKCFNFGMITIFYLFYFLLPLYIILFNIAAGRFANMKNKEKEHYVIYIILIISFLLSALTFIDEYDSGASIKIINFVPENTLRRISNISIIICIITSIIRNT